MQLRDDSCECRTIDYKGKTLNLVQYLIEVQVSG